MKRQIPLRVLQVIEPLLNKDHELVTVCKKKDRLLSIVEKDNVSEFFFEITNFEYRNSSMLLTIFRKPQNEYIIESFSERIPLDTLDKYFESWLKIIESYAKVRTYYDDPILESYQKEFIETFKIVDEDSDFRPFNLNQQFAIDKHLEFIIATLKEEEESAEVTEIINDSTELKNELGKLTKTEAFNKLCRIWGKTRKYSLQILKFIMTKSFEKLIELAITKGFEALQG